MKVQHQFFISRLSFYLFGFLFFGLSSQTTSVLAQTIPDAIANNSPAQVTNVRELQDVYPSDWAYEALRSLTERYGCISSGFPNGTYKGSKPLTRHEFAAGLNSCLNRIENSLLTAM